MMSTLCLQGVTQIQLTKVTQIQLTKVTQIQLTKVTHFRVALTVVVSKVKGQPRGRDHINGIEGFWSYAKHWLYQYRGVPRTTFHLFWKEIAFRFNNRDENLVPFIMKLLSRCTR